MKPFLKEYISFVSYRRDESIFKLNELSKKGSHFSSSFTMTESGELSGSTFADIKIKTEWN